MSRTGLDGATLANSLRAMAGDGSIEWVCEPIQASVLLDIADMLDENAKLRELVRDFDKCLTEAVRLAYIQGHMTIYDGTPLDSLHPRMRELGIEVSE